MKKFRYIKEYNQFGYDSNSDLFSDRFLSISDDFNLREMISNNGTWGNFNKDLYSGWWFAFPIKDNGLEFRLTIKKQYLTDDFKKALYGFLKKFEEISGLKMLTWGEHFSTPMANDKNLLSNSFIFSNPKNIYEPHFVNANELRDIPKINESFNNIESICKKYNITNYTINADGSIDVNGNVYLDRNGLAKLPLKFGRVTGNFNCYDNQLTTLEGSPREVGGYFYCYDNKLTTLEGGPREVGGDFNCSYNQLTTLEGSPGEVGGSFYCHDNQLTTLEGGPREVGGAFNCYDNKLTTLEGAPREVGGYFSCQYNELTTLEGSPREVGGDFNCQYNQLTTLEGAPREIGCDFDCSHNQLTTLEGGPREVGGNFYCSHSPIYSVYQLFPDHKTFMDSLDYNYLRVADIVKVRFQEALDELGIKMPNKINGYNWI
jgi:hypothetical protein